jgi:hypothetical protein
MGCEQLFLVSCTWDKYDTLTKALKCAVGMAASSLSYSAILSMLCKVDDVSFPCAYVLVETIARAQPYMIEGCVL